ncbi:MAG: hypothetical protein ACPHRO_00100 [Nannocystaceae bacterium]
MRRTQRPRPLRRIFVTCALAFALASSHTASSRAADACNPDLLCAISGTVSFKPEAKISRGSLRKDYKKYRRRKKVPVTFIVAEGRASVFIDGVYEGTTPTEPIPLRPGRHDIQLRDRDLVVSQGVMRISTRSDEAVMKVRHPSARPTVRPSGDVGPPPPPPG